MDHNLKEQLDSEFDSGKERAAVIFQRQVAVTGDLGLNTKE